MTSVAAVAQEDESKVPAYTLPDVLRDEQGRSVESADAWREGRRAAVLDLLARHEYGRTPGGRFPGQRWEVTAYDATALGGRATRKEVTLRLTGAATGPARPGLRRLYDGLRRVAVRHRIPARR